MEKQKKKWVRPKLIVLVKTPGSINLLLGCKLPIYTVDSGNSNIGATQPYSAWSGCWAYNCGESGYMNHDPGCCTNNWPAGEDQISGACSAWGGNGCGCHQCSGLQWS